jgi:uncharacterized protein (DUF433 family)
MSEFERITFNPKIMMGQACIRGMRVTVALIINLVSCGKLVQEILEEYPSLEAEDIKQSLQYAEWLVRQQRIHPRELQIRQDDLDSLDKLEFELKEAA